MSTVLEQFAPYSILMPAQEPADVRLDVSAFGPNQFIYAGQAVAMKTADGKLYAYSTSGSKTAAGAATGVVSAGGSLATGEYLTKITARYGTGNAAAGTESAAATTTTGNQTITWTWAAVAGATGYDVYRTAAGGSTGTEVFLVSLPSNFTSFTDTGSIAPGTATPPSTSSAPSDGTQTCVGLSQYSFSTDSSGLVVTWSSAPRRAWPLAPRQTIERRRIARCPSTSLAPSTRPNSSA